MWNVLVHCRMVRAVSARKRSRHGISLKARDTPLHARKLDSRPFGRITKRLTPGADPALEIGIVADRMDEHRSVDRCPPHRKGHLMAARNPRDGDADLGLDARLARQE